MLCCPSLQLKTAGERQHTLIYLLFLCYIVIEFFDSNPAWDTGLRGQSAIEPLYYREVGQRSIRLNPVQSGSVLPHRKTRWNSRAP
jgi:hypothetical protein